MVYFKILSPFPYNWTLCIVFYLVEWNPLKVVKKTMMQKETISSVHLKLILKKKVSYVALLD